MIATNWAMRQLAGPDPLELADPAAVTPADRDVLASGDDIPAPTAKVTFYVQRDDQRPYLRDVEDYAFESLLVFDYTSAAC